MTQSFEAEFQNIYTGDDPDGTKRAKVIDSPYLHKLQRFHFILFDVIPILGTAIAIALSFFIPITIVDISLFFFMWAVTGFGISAGYHRLFAHRSFKTTPAIRVLLGIAGSMAGQGGIISWVAMHRRHHEYGDKEGDMHSPNLSGPGWKGKLRGFIHSHFVWMIAHPYPNVVHYAPDLLRDPPIVAVSRRYYFWAGMGFLIPAVLGGLLSLSWMGIVTGFLWGGMVRMFALEQGIWSLNSFCHLFGSRLFATRDESRNIGLLSPFIFGESWHHNHHAFPNSAWFGLKWYRVDPGFWFIKALGMLGLASDIKVPSERQLELRMIGN
jgi:stearoyl-CoA desaturase (Delta-9 desaturase)